MKRGWIAALLLALTACGGGSDGSATTEPGGGATADAASTAAATPEADLESAYRAYVKAFLAGDGATAYQLLSQRCRDKEALSEFAAIAESAGELYGDVDYTINSVTVDGDHGSIDATYAVEALNSPGGSAWVHEDGGWHSDKCG